MKTKETIIHIPERGCHNCRLHCVNHKECDAEYPCKQGGEWRPIESAIESQEVITTDEDIFMWATIQPYKSNLHYIGLIEGAKAMRDGKIPSKEREGKETHPCDGCPKTKKQKKTCGDCMD